MRINNNIQYTTEMIMGKTAIPTLQVTVKQAEWGFEQLTICLNRQGVELADVVIDLTEVTSLSSAALAQLVLLKRHLKLQGVNFTIHGVSGQPLAHLELYHLNPMLLDHTQSFGTDVAAA